MKICRAGVFLSGLLMAMMVLDCSETHSADWDKPVVFAPIYVSGIAPAVPPASKLLPGLVPYYYVEFFERHLDQLPATESSRYPSFKGKPILELNHQFGKDEVFDSKTSRGVGIRMRGFINFSSTGEHELQALSNDGVILKLSGVVALNDPEQHSDRLSNLAYVTIEEPGWYAMEIEYFQRKGTAALKLFWKPPGAEGMEPVPAQVLAHLP